MRPLAVFEIALYFEGKTVVKSGILLTGSETKTVADQARPDTAFNDNPFRPRFSKVHISSVPYPNVNKTISKEAMDFFPTDFYHVKLYFYVLVISIFFNNNKLN